jgi:heptosyltransferase-2
MKEFHKIFLDGIMHLGDIFMSASVLPVLRKHYPDAEIHYLVKDNLVSAAALLDGVDRIIPYAYRSGGGYMDVYRMGRKLAREHYDVGISLDPRERVTLMKWFAHMPIRLSMERALGWELGWEKYFYTDDLHFRKPWDYREHRMSESFQRLLKDYLGDASEDFIPPSVRPSTEEEIRQARLLLNPVQACRTKVAFAVETTTKTKDWPTKKIAEVADWLAETYHAGIVMTGIASHEERIRDILRQMKHQEAVVDVAGKTSLTVLIALFREVQLLLTLDTGSAHIAAVAGCPVITIFSHNSPEIYRAASAISRAISGHVPCSGKHTCIGPSHCSKMDCVDCVSTDMVKKEIQQVMELVR